LGIFADLGDTDFMSGFYGRQVPDKDLRGNYTFHFIKYGDKKNLLSCIEYLLLV